MPGWQMLFLVFGSVGLLAIILSFNIIVNLIEMCGHLSETRSGKIILVMIPVFPIVLYFVNDYRVKLVQEKGYKISLEWLNERAYDRCFDKDEPRKWENFGCDHRELKELYQRAKDKAGIWPGVFE